MKVEGCCHCGRLTFTAEVDPARVAVCHCTDCQIMSGSAFRTVVQVAAEDFALRSGEPRFYEKQGDSGNRRALAFCGDCGTQIYATTAEPPRDVLGLRVGTLDRRAELIPRLEVWCRSRLGWLPGFDDTACRETQ